MKVKAGDIMNAYSALQELVSMKMPVKGAVTVALLLKKMHEDWKVFEDKRGAKVKELGTPTEKDPNMFQISSEKIAEYNAFIAELVDTDLTVEYPKLRMDMFGSADIAPVLIAQLGPFFELEEQEYEL